MNAYNYILQNQNKNFSGGIADALAMAQMMKQQNQVGIGNTLLGGNLKDYEQPQMPNAGIPEQPSSIFDKDTLTVNYGDVSKQGGHRNWRNNNPGNIEYGDFAKRMGAIGTDGRFAIFPDMETGYNAQKSLLTSGSYRDLPLSGAISRYAPSSENDVNAYVGSLTNMTGISPSSTIGSLSDEQLNQLVRAMSQVEGMKQGQIINRGA